MHSPKCSKLILLKMVVVCIQPWNVSKKFKQFFVFTLLWVDSVKFHYSSISFYLNSTYRQNIKLEPYVRYTVKWQISLLKGVYVLKRNFNKSRLLKLKVWFRLLLFKDNDNVILIFFYGIYNLLSFYWLQITFYD